MTDTRADALKAGDAFIAALLILKDECWAGVVRDLLAEMRADFEEDDG